MYIGALIRFPDGKHKIVESEGYLAIPKFTFAIGEHAKAENKLVKVVCDDVRALSMLSKSLDGVKVEFGFKGVLEIELNEKQEA